MKYSSNANQSMKAVRNLGSCKVSQVPVTQQQLLSKVPQAPWAAPAPGSALPHKGSSYGEEAASSFQEMGLQTLPFRDATLLQTSESSATPNSNAAPHAVSKSKNHWNPIKLPTVPHIKANSDLTGPAAQIPAFL